MMNKHGKSDRPIVPGKSPNKARVPVAEEMEGRGLAKGNLGQQNAFRTQSRVVAPSELAQIRQTATSNKDVKFTALMHHIYRIDTLRFAYSQLKRHAAAGVDGETWRHYGEALEENLQNLSHRLKRGAYRAKPVRTGDRSRHDIPSVMHDSTSHNGETIMQWSGTISGEWKTVAFALSEAFTKGLSKTRFVVWWHKAAERFVPGLFCPDIVTALYALALWSTGTAGGWAICQKCRKDFARKRAKQLYCSPQCQTAAGMSRMRQKRRQLLPVNSRTAANEKGNATEEL